MKKAMIVLILSVSCLAGLAAPTAAERSRVAVARDAKLRGSGSGIDSSRIAALLDKPSRRKHPVEADYLGFTIPDEFVVGYGLDYAEKYRNLPDICILPQTGLTKE